MASIRVFNKKVSFEGLHLSGVLERYLETENVAIELYDEYGEFYKLVTLDSKSKLPKTNNAIINDKKDCAGILDALKSIDMVKVVGKTDVNLRMYDLVLVNTRAFKEIDEDLFLEFAKSSLGDFNQFLTKMNEEEVEETESEDMEVEVETEEIIAE
ncbi:hypothetical protein [uncultured Clostridium sp.]|uniref:hypothetical protein n=1 Tax=uncultured Clostridium sp. TaxID=59620 RepID=UPI002632F0E1|nr:hypothetical protein [uncultured Clostridium sp.]